MSFGIGMPIFAEDFCNINLTFPLLMQLSGWYWTWFNLVFLVRCIQLNHSEHIALFTTHLVYADISRKTCFGRGICFTSRYFQHILHKKVFNRFVHTFQKLRESKIKGCTLFSTSLSYVCVKDCSGTIIDIIVKNIGHTYINEKNKKQRKMGPPQRPTL